MMTKNGVEATVSKVTGGSPVYIPGIPPLTAAVRPKLGEAVEFPGGLSVTLERINPDVAQAYLLRNHKDNRNCGSYRVDKIAGDLTTNRFQTTHEGIAFDLEDNLVDGQGRLNAIIKANVAAVLFVFRGLTPASMAVINTGQSRTTKDAMQIMGDNDVTKNHISTLRAMQSGVKGKFVKSSTSSEIDLYNRHKEAITFVCDMHHPAKYKTFYNASVRGVLARAWYTQDKAKLREFATKLVTGELNYKEDAPIQKLREYLLKYGGVGGAVAFADNYQKAQVALWKFLTGERMVRLTGREDEIFALPS
jgi:hypothetical protein